jgi:hypothetical protein
MRTFVTLVGVVLLSSAVVGCGGGGAAEDSQGAGADIKQADCAPALEVSFGAPKIDTDAEIQKAADNDGVEFKGLAAPLKAARELKPITALATFTDAHSGACNYKLTTKAGGAAVDGSLHTIGTPGHFFMRYEVSGVIYNATLDTITKTEIKLHDGSATVMLNDGGSEFHGEPDPSVPSGSVDVKASIAN